MNLMVECFSFIFLSCFLREVFFKISGAKIGLITVMPTLSETLKLSAALTISPVMVSTAKMTASRSSKFAVCADCYSLQAILLEL